MLGAMDAGPSEGDEQVVFLHGSSAARLFRLSAGQEESGLPVCIAATLLDGYVLALKSFNHSCNYRSAVIFGHATMVTNTDEMPHAIELITNHLITDCWDNSRTPPTKAELTATGILKVRIETASVKVRNGGPHDDKKDLKDGVIRARVWTGTVPVYHVLGEPVASPENEVKQIPTSVSAWIGNTNNTRRDQTLRSMDEWREAWVMAIPSKCEVINPSSIQSKSATIFSCPSPCVSGLSKQRAVHGPFADVRSISD